jgi:hypothetical protein
MNKFVVNDVNAATLPSLTNDATLFPSMESIRNNYKINKNNNKNNIKSINKSTKFFIGLYNNEAICIIIENGILIKDLIFKDIIRSDFSIGSDENGIINNLLLLYLFCCH